VEGGAIKGSLGNGEIQLEKVLRIDPAEAAGYAALPIVGRSKGIMLLLRGVEPKDIDQEKR